MIDNAALKTILATADDFTVVAEVYASSAAPPFTPSSAEKRFAPIGGLTFAGASYDKKVVQWGRAKRTIGKEVNTCSLTLDNTDGSLAAWELSNGFEGKILVLRLISRSQSTATNSLILFVGRCERPDSGTRSSISLTATQVVGAIDTELPRRKFQYDDPEGRVPSDKLFEGFRYTPQYGTVTYSRRQRLWWASWLLTREIKKFQQYSSYSDIDANKSVPVVLGRGQVMGVHLCYADVGTFLHIVTAFCEGPIADMTNFRTDDTRFYFYNNSSGSAGYPALNQYEKRYGYAGGTGPTGRVQNTFSLGDIEGNGYYSKTAYIYGLLAGTDNLQIDPAPGVAAVVLGQLVTVPTSGGAWSTTDTWTDNPAAHAYFLLTSSDYGRLDSSWIDEASFTEAYRYNDGVIYDPSFSDQIGTPSGSANFADGTTELGKFFASTGLITTKYFNYLAGTASESSTFFRIPPVTEYASGEVAGLTEEPGETPNPRPGPGSNGRNWTIRRRFTSNVVVTDTVKVSDFLHDVVFGASRMFLSQNYDGKLKLRHKKPVPQTYCANAPLTSSVLVENVLPFASGLPCQVVIDPNTSVSEVRTVTAVSYSSSTPTVTASSTGSFVTVGSFSANSTTVPKSLTITFGTPSGSSFTLTLRGIDITLGIFSDDDANTLAGWAAYSINGHPELSRRFKADWTPGTNTVTLTYYTGRLTLDSNPSLTHDEALTDPTSAPSCTAGSGGAIGAGDVYISYSYVNQRGETKASPKQTLTVSANGTISFPTVSLPTGATGIRWYASVSPYSGIQRLVKENTGSSFTASALPKLSTRVPPSANTTAAEIMQVSAVFSDKAETRSASSRSNVLKGTFKWSLAKRSQVKNWVEVQFRDSSADYRLTTLNLKDDAHIAKIKKTNKLTVSGAAIDNYNQAYRIASGALAENLDANFLYQWSADREALLLEEGDVVAITDSGLGVVNLPVRIEEIEMSLDKSFPTVSYTARKYSTSLYDDSVAERQIPVVIEAGLTDSFAP